MGRVQMKTLRKLWYSLNYRYCMSSAYLAKQRGDYIPAAEFLNNALYWQSKYRTEMMA